MNSLGENVREVKKMADQFVQVTNEKLLRIKTGYDQHTSLLREPASYKTPQDGKLIEYMMYLQKNGRSEATVRIKFKILRFMAKNNVSLNDPEQVKLYIARRKEWSDGHKILAVYAYNDYAKMENILFTPPYYQNNNTLPFVPTEKEIEALISETSKKISISLQALKETGFRIGELWNCKWSDLDEEKSTIKCRAEKHGLPREIRVTAKLIQRLNTLPKDSEYIFSSTSLSNHRWRFARQKTALAKKLQNPRLRQIHFHTFRHYYATRIYSETKSILEVQAKLGHRRIDSTMVYTHIIEFDEESQNYHHAVARDEREAGELIDNGWTYVLTTPQNIMMFRKRK